MTLWNPSARKTKRDASTSFRNRARYAGAARYFIPVTHPRPARPRCVEPRVYCCLLKHVRLGCCPSFLGGWSENMPRCLPSNSQARFTTLDPPFTVLPHSKFHQLLHHPLLVYRQPTNSFPRRGLFNSAGEFLDALPYLLLRQCDWIRVDRPDDLIDSAKVWLAPGVLLA
jgi:hypothetical protein